MCPLRGAGVRLLVCGNCILPLTHPLLCQPSCRATHTRGPLTVPETCSKGQKTEKRPCTGDSVYAR